MDLKYSVGIDVDSKILESNFSVIDAQQAVRVFSSRQFNNTASDYQQMAAWIAKYHKDKKLPVVINMEASGVYHENCAHYLHKQGYRVSITLANRANQYLKLIGDSKNDKLDAKGLARMGAEQHLREWHPPSEFYVKLRSLTRFRAELQNKKTAEQSQLHAIEHSACKDSWIVNKHEQAIKRYTKQIKQTDKRIADHLSTNPTAMRKVDQICSKIKGVARLTVAVLAGETFGFKLFENHRQLISYSGYDVVENQSGRRVGKTRISKKGNSYIRRILFFPALNVVQFKVPEFVAFYERLSPKHGKLKMKTYVAIQKKLLVLIYTLWKNDAVYDPDYYLNHSVENTAQAG